jgi:hypothetical protein
MQRINANLRKVGDYLPIKRMDLPWPDINHPLIGGSIVRDRTFCSSHCALCVNLDSQGRGLADVLEGHVTKGVRLKLDAEQTACRDCL